MTLHHIFTDGVSPLCPESSSHEGGESLAFETVHETLEPRAVRQWHGSLIKGDRLTVTIGASSAKAPILLEVLDGSFRTLASERVQRRRTKVTIDAARSEVHYIRIRGSDRDCTGCDFQIQIARPR